MPKYAHTVNIDFQFISNNKEPKHKEIVKAVKEQIRFLKKYKYHCLDYDISQTYPYQDND